MSRPTKAIVDYFPHFANHGPTMFILENKFGNDGYTAWFKLLEVLSTSENHFFDCRNVIKWEFLLAKIKIPHDLALEFFDLCSTLDAIDKELWKFKIIYSRNFVECVKDAYKRRSCELPTREVIVDILKLNVNINGVNDDQNPQSKVKYSKVKQIKKDADAVIGYLNTKAKKRFRLINTNREGIIARFEEGYSVEECKKVVDNQIKDQYFIDNPKFLNPVTLYRKKNFATYLENIPVDLHSQPTITDKKLYLPEGKTCFDCQFSERCQTPNNQNYCSQGVKESVFSLKSK
jgi:uncharacterized phage protein (TIGR02220 family)